MLPLCVSHEARLCTISMEGNNRVSSTDNNSKLERNCFFWHPKQVFQNVHADRVVASDLYLHSCVRSNGFTMTWWYCRMCWWYLIFWGWMQHLVMTMGWLLLHGVCQGFTYLGQNRGDLVGNEDVTWWWWAGLCYIECARVSHTQDRIGSILLVMKTSHDGGGWPLLHKSVPGFYWT